jgi:carbamoyltransferase
MTADPVSAILAVNFNHDGAGALLVEGRLAGWVCTERGSRLKKHPGLREADLDDLLDQAGIGIADIGHVLLCNLHNMDTPDVEQLHGSDLKETWLEFWVNQRNDEVLLRGRRIPCTVNPDHHLLHAAAAFYTSPFDDAAVLAIDPTGCRAFAGRGERLYPLRRGYDSWFTAAVGYTHAAVELFGTAIVGAGKVMGLAPYGAPEGEPPDLGHVCDFASLMEVSNARPVPVEVEGRVLNAALAHNIQYGLELQLGGALADLAAVARRNGIAPNLCLAGGTALNATANQRCFAASGFDRLHLHPACGDDGTAIGAALWFWHHELGRPRRRHGNPELMFGVRTYRAAEIDAAVAAAAGPAGLTVTRTSDVAAHAARLIAGGDTVGWFDGAAEIGPRALGHRSILADPRSPTMRHRLNAEVKFREQFRPFAPSVLNEHAAACFGLTDSPFMLRMSDVLAPGLPAITHVDGTSRIQTVEAADCPGLHAVISAFAALTGTPLVLNTSLNSKGRPIDETPADALATLLASGLDHLAFPGVLVSKRQVAVDGAATVTA